jgi:hypothetical protein
MSGGRRSAIKEERRAQRDAGDMHGGGHPASLAFEASIQSFDTVQNADAKSHPKSLAFKAAIHQPGRATPQPKVTDDPPPYLSTNARSIT